jgi:hypothetical protein
MIEVKPEKKEFYNLSFYIETKFGIIEKTFYQIPAINYKKICSLSKIEQFAYAVRSIEIKDSRDYLDIKFNFIDNSTPESVSIFIDKLENLKKILGSLAEKYNLRVDDLKFKEVIKLDLINKDPDILKFLKGLVNDSD